MLVFVEVQIALGLLIFRAQHSVGGGEFGHDQAASTKVADESPKHGVGDARHRRKHGRRRDLDIADHDPIRHGRDRTGEDARACIRRIVPVLAHLAILLPFPTSAAVSQFASHTLMDEIPQTSSPEWSAAETGRWIGRVVIAVILAEAIWGFIASLTSSLILPLLARTMGGDAQSPLYLGKGDINVPALFAAVLELCFAGIVAALLNSVVQRKPKMIRVKSVRVSPIPAQPAAPPAPAVAPVKVAVSEAPPITPVVAYTAPQPPAPPPATTTPEQFSSPPEPAPQPKAAAPPPPAKPPAKPAKPKPPKEIYYNIVGEPINPTEDD
jgi:hypothetical protein